MIIYEVTVMLEPDIESEYRDWIESHIRDIIKIQGFIGATLCTLLHQPRPSLVIAYQVKDEACLEHYLKQHAPAFRKEATDKFGSKFLAGRRILRIEKEIALENA